MTSSPRAGSLSWAPLGDYTLSRKKWYRIAISLVSVGFIALSMVPLKPSTMPLFVGHRLLTGIAATFIAFATEGLMTHNSPPAARGRRRLVPEREPVRADRGRRTRPVPYEALAAPWMAGAGSPRSCGCAPGAERRRGTAAPLASRSPGARAAMHGVNWSRSYAREVGRIGLILGSCHRQRNGAAVVRLHRKRVAAPGRHGVGCVRTRRRARDRRGLFRRRTARGSHSEARSYATSCGLECSRRSPSRCAAHRDRLHRRARCSTRSRSAWRPPPSPPWSWRSSATPQPPRNQPVLRAQHAVQPGHAAGGRLGARHVQVRTACSTRKRSSASRHWWCSRSSRGGCAVRTQRPLRTRKFMTGTGGAAAGRAQPQIQRALHDGLWRAAEFEQRDRVTARRRPGREAIVEGQAIRSTASPK